METTLKELKILLRNSKASGSSSWIDSSPNHSTAIISEVWFLIWNHSALSVDVPLRYKLTNFESFGFLLKEFGTKNMENVRLEIKDIEKLRYESSSLILYKELSE